MSEDIVQRLRANWPNISESIDAAKEIERLRAELAAEQEQLAQAAKDANEKAAECEFIRIRLVSAETDVRRLHAYYTTVMAHYGGDALAHCRAERDAMRAVVQAAFDMKISNHPEWEALARAALNKGGGGDDEQ